MSLFFDFDSPEYSGPLAGVMGYLNTAPPWFATEIGHIVIFPPWQRTFVTTNAAALLIMHALDSPEKGGWGFRRVQWLSSVFNTASIKAAQRMGMKLEGVVRWQTNKAPKDDQGRAIEGKLTPGSKDYDTALLATCWDDWDRTALEALIARVS